MMLNELLKGIHISASSGALGVDVRGIAYDSRAVKPGYLFIAMQGEKVDGHQFVENAVNAGASAVLSQKGIADPGVPWVCVRDSRAALADIARVFYGYPDESLKIAGITGTNGKSTVAHLVYHALKAIDGTAGLIGTIEHDLGRERVPARLTTPEASDTLAMFSRMIEHGCTAAVMEASSVAIDRQRVRGFHFDVVAFTNFSRDHLDYHGDMNRYFAAKRKLFSKTSGNTPAAVINVDDEAGQRLIKEIDLPVVTCGLQEDADLRAEDVAVSRTGLSFTLLYQGGGYAIQSNLLGEFNVSNILIAIGCCLGMGYSLQEVVSHISAAPAVRGRMEPVPGEHPFTVVVDYAHTDDALKNVLSAANAITEGRVISVFGCGGDRDPGKRPLMGVHAVENSDIAVLTSDNPRTEDPLRIIAEVRKGIDAIKNPRAELIVEPDRRAAIHAAVKQARSGDLVVIAGKGHETYQIAGDTTVPFDDRTVAQEALAAL